MSSVIKCQSPSGVFTLPFDSDISVQEFRKIVHEKTEIEPDYQIILIGFPPKEISLNESEKIGNVISKGDMIRINKSDVKLDRIDTGNNIENKTEIVNSDEQHDKDQTQKDVNKPQESDQEPSKIERLNKLFVSDLDIMFPIKITIPDDNSCLFSAISYCFEDRFMGLVPKLRRVVADRILNDPTNYSEAILGRSPSDYCKWILNKNSWGGAIELSILSDHYKAEICAFDVTNPRANIFGEGNNYDTRAYLIYDGIHYDALGISLTKDKFPDFTLFDPNDQNIYQKFLKLTKEENEKGKYTNTQTFSLKCNICQTALIGEKSAVEHAKTTGHTDFVENTK